MGWCTLMCDTGAWSAEQHAAARRQLELYKQSIRPLINRGDLYHISGRPAEGAWDGMEYMDLRRGKGVVFAFRGAKASESSHRFRLKGLKPAARFDVWSEDGSLERSQSAGASLMDQGLTVDLPQPGTSDLIFLKIR